MKAPFILALVVVVSFLTVFLRRLRPEQALAVSLAAGVAVLLLALSWLGPVFEQLGEWLSLTGLSEQYTDILYKGIGVALVTQLAADTCRDAGETALASKAETVGKLCLLLLALPLLRQVSDLAFSMLQGAGI